MEVIDNRRCKGCHGEMLERIYRRTCDLASQADVFVREGCYVGTGYSTVAMIKVHGVCDLALWQTRQVFFDDIQPALVKKLVAGDGRATKEEVAQALAQFVGPMEYANDDESDAVAIGVSWLLVNGWGDR
jgi:crossover junction endodeoxyribonuclease RuvC